MNSTKKKFYINILDEIDDNKEEIINIVEYLIGKAEAILGNAEREKVFRVREEFLKYQDIITKDGTIYKIWKILEILDLEYENMDTIFCNNLYTIDELVDKYIKTTLMIRRIEMEMSDDLICETIDYLKSNKVSKTAIDKIIEKEKFTDKNRILEEIDRLYE